MASGTIENRNRRVMLICFGMVAGMVGLAYASVPLYEWFCRVTGYGGTTQRAETVPDTITNVPIQVLFNADKSPHLPWTFEPVQRSITLKAGESGLAFYRATNDSDQPVVGTATFNVTPLKIGAYFAKVECFCFTEQLLQPGESVEMPVQFFLDPEMVTDVATQEVRTVTLSYTFFPITKDPEEIPQQTSALPSDDATQ